MRAQRLNQRTNAVIHRPNADFWRMRPFAATHWAPGFDIERTRPANTRHLPPDTIPIATIGSVQWDFMRSATKPPSRAALFARALHIKSSAFSVIEPHWRAKNEGGVGLIGQIFGRSVKERLHPFLAGFAEPE